MRISSEFMSNQEGKYHAWLGGKRCCVNTQFQAMQ